MKIVLESPNNRSEICGGFAFFIIIILFLVAIFPITFLIISI